MPLNAYGIFKAIPNIFKVVHYVEKVFRKYVNINIIRDGQRLVEFTVKLVVEQGCSVSTKDRWRCLNEVHSPIKRHGAQTSRSS